MNTVRLIYYSVATRDIAMSDLKQILETARKNNSDLGICGMLCFENRYFLQVLEGPRDAVSELYLDIADDARHDELTLICCEEITETSFSEWRMGYAGSSDKLQAILNKEDQLSFDPKQMNKTQAYAVLTAMAAHQDNI